MALPKYVILRNIKDGKLYLDDTPSTMSVAGMEIDYYDNVGDARARYPDAVDVTKPAQETRSETEEEKE